jgi:Flp pilus assembly secretin CpaC
VIGQKKNEADIRLKDGEVSLLGGLMSDQDTSVIGGIPGLVNIPILGKYLFGNTSKDKQKEQLMIALIPHIVRRPDINQPTLDIRNDSGEASIEMSRVKGVPGVNGSGPLMQFTFVAVGKGSAGITVTDVNLKNSKQETVTAKAPSVMVNVQ